MNLVNDVLRQLDENSVKPHQTMPLHSLITEQLVKKNKLPGIIFILLIVFLFFILTLQIFYKKSLVDIFYFNDFKRVEVPQQSMWPTRVSKNNIAGEHSNSNAKNITTPERVLVIEGASGSARTSKENIEVEVTNGHLIESKPIESEMLKVSMLKKKSDQYTLEINNDQMPIIDDASRADAVKKDRLIQYSEVKDIKIKNTKINNKKINNLKNKIAVKKNNYQKARITAVKNIGLQHYQLSLRAYKNKQTSVALSRIDLALAAEKKDEYLRLKVRILMQKGNGDELYRFVLAQNDNESLNWFQLVAPSLQLYAYYDLSNKYYSKLIKQQPNDVKWLLAMALNYSKLEQNEKTYSIYKNLLNSSLLTDKQQSWIAKRLGRIAQSKVAINER
jgi:hypothetical protein